MSRRDISEMDQNAALEAYRAAACAEADAHFDDRALETQRHKILDRLAHLGHPARVIRFPKVGNVDLLDGGVNRRWISVAAAAGLIIGLVGGQLVHIVPQSNNNRRLSPMATSVVAPSAPAAPAFVPISASVDDGLLGEVEMAMQFRIATELRALDDFTPLADQR
jgi:hypothetical protein